MPRMPNRRDFLKTLSATSVATAAGTTLMSAAAKAAPPFFKLYLMIPNNQPTRMVWGTLAAQQMSKLGIDVISSFVPFTVIAPRRSKGEGKTHVEGGWDGYLERYYYSSILPVPIKLFEKRWYDIEPMTILFYPEDVIAVNPKLKGFDTTTFNPVFFPNPENWIIEGGGNDASAAFASWPAPTSLVPMFTIGYQESNIFGPVYNRLYEYDSWDGKKLVPALAESHTMSDDGKHWVIKLRQGVQWHSGEEFTANDVKFTWDTILNKAYTSQFQAAFQQIFGSPDAYKITGKYEIRVELPQYTLLFLDWALGAMAIMPEHAYKDIKPEAMRGHTISSWLGSFTVTTSDGKPYAAKGGIGTGPWVVEGYDPSKKAYKYSKNEKYWKKTPGNVKTFYVVNIQGTDSVLSALKAGEIDTHDPMYDIGPLVSTIDAKWGKVQSFDSYKWQHICYNLLHPVFGTGVDTPLGKQDPSRAAEAAAYIRKAISHAMPRDQIVSEIAGGYGKPGTVPMPYSAPEYDHDLLKPIAFDMDVARQYMEKAGYKY